MATAYENNLSCAVCLELYDDPRILPCGHSYCLKCLLDLQNIKCSSKDVIKCPICQSESCYEHGGQASLYTKNYELNSLVQAFILEGNTNITPGEEYLCDICDCDPRAHARRACIDCEMMYCEACFNTCHPLKGKLRNHKIVDADKKLKRQIDTKGDERNMYCTDCDTLISVADINSHSRHEVVSLDKARSIFKVKLEEETGDINLMQSTLESALEKSMEKLHSVEAIFERIEHEVATKKEEVLSKLKADVKEAEATIDNVMSAISTHRELQSRADTIYFIEECQNILRRTSLKQDYNDVRLQLGKIDSLTFIDEAVINEIRKLELCAVSVPSLQFDHQRAGYGVRVSTDGKKIAFSTFAAELLGDHYHQCKNKMLSSFSVPGYPRMTAGRLYWEVEAEHAAGEMFYFYFGVTSSATPEDCGPIGDATSWGVSVECDKAKTTIVMRHASQGLHTENIDVASRHLTHRHGLLLDVDQRSLSVINVKRKKCIYVFTNVDTSHGVTPVFQTWIHKCTLRLVDPNEILRAPLLPFSTAAVC